MYCKPQTLRLYFIKKTLAVVIMKIMIKSSQIKVLSLCLVSLYCRNHLIKLYDFRNCIGQNFAMNEMKVALSQVVRNFRIYLDEETPESKMQVWLILQSQDGIHVKFQSIKD